MMNFNLPKRSNREQLEELVRSGYRPYLCGDTGYGVVIAWARSVYVYSLGGLEPDVHATLQRVSDALGCSDVKRASIEPSLEYLLSSSIKLIVDDFGNALLKPVVSVLEQIA